MQNPLVLLPLHLVLVCPGFLGQLVGDDRPRACIARCKGDTKQIVPNATVVQCRNVREVGSPCLLTYKFGGETPCAGVPSDSYQLPENDTAYPLHFDYFDFDNINTCYDYYNNFIVPRAKGKPGFVPSTNATEVQATSCNCTSMITDVMEYGYREVVADGSSFCDAVVARFDVAGSICRSAPPGFFRNVCEHGLGIVTGAVVGAVATPVCELMVRMIQELTKLDLNNIFKQVESIVSGFIDTTSKRLCGTLTCGESGDPSCTAASINSDSSVKVVEVVTENLCNIKTAFSSGCFRQLKKSTNFARDLTVGASVFAIAAPHGFFGPSPP